MTARTKEFPNPPTFLLATSQIGAERAVKAEVNGRWPDVHAAYSRPGFLTFKVPADHPIHEEFALPSIFARSAAISLGKAEGNTGEELAESVWRLSGEREFAKLHVWQRDLLPAGDHGFSPTITATAREAEGLIRASQSAVELQRPCMSELPTAPGDLVLDCILVEPHEWWLGMHRATGPAGCWPGGICSLELPADAVSRAYLKMEEAIRWSEMPLARGEHCVEIGCAPGGASQALLARGLFVTGIDPAEVDPRVLAHPRFTHIKKRGADVRRREFRDFQWLTADLNVAPAYTLDTVEAIVVHPAANIRGLLLTLKLLDWDLARHVPEYLSRVAGWGYRTVRARQLSQNRQEFCVAAER